jgi:hypothetical protein
MTQPEQRYTHTLAQRMRGLPAVFAVATVALVFLVVMSWRAASTRITALEARLDELTETLDQRLPDRNWRAELERVAKDLEARANERLRRDRQRLTADLEARVQALTMHPESADPPQGGPRSMKDLDVAPEAPVSPQQFVESGAASGDVQEREEGELFKRGHQSLYRSLELSPERREELGTGLEEILGAFWPEYVALLKSSDPDTSAWGSRLCAEVLSILTPEEAARIGCGPSAIMVPKQPGAVETISEPPTQDWSQPPSQ